MKKRRLNRAWEWLLPDTEDALVRGRAGLVIATGLGLTAAIGGLVLTWIISGDLQWETPVAGAIFILLLTAIGALARTGRATLAAWTLVTLLMLLITADVAYYGVGSTSAAAYVIPITLAACGLGWWAGLGVAGVSAAWVWLLAGAEAAGGYTPALPPADYHLTLSAPVLTVLFLAVALIAGLWSRYLSVQLSAVSRQQQADG